MKGAFEVGRTQNLSTEEAAKYNHFKGSLIVFFSFLVIPFFGNARAEAIPSIHQKRI